MSNESRLRKGGRIMELGDFAEASLTTRVPSGYSLHNGKRAVTLAIIKHDEESMEAMNEGSRLDHKIFLRPLS